MYIQKIHIENFRLLKNVDIVLDKSLTLIVGKNTCVVPGRGRDSLF